MISDSLTSAQIGQDHAQAVGSLFSYMWWPLARLVLAINAEIQNLFVSTLREFSEILGRSPLTPTGSDRSMIATTDALMVSTLSTTRRVELPAEYALRGFRTGNGSIKLENSRDPKMAGIVLISGVF